MKIIYDHQAFSMQKYGGISRYYYEISNHVASMEGQEVEIFAPLYINEYFRNSDKLYPWGVKIPCLPKTGRIVRAVNLIASTLRIKSRRDVDIFHETYYSKVDCCPRSAKRVITVYDMYNEIFADKISERNKTQQIKAYAVRQADHIICISENTRRDLIGLLGVPEEKTSVVYLGYSLITKNVAAKPVEGKKPFILYVGNRGKYKNFEGLLRAYGSSSLLKKELSLICFGGGDLSTRELAIVKSLNISPDNIIHVDGNDDILACLYASATVFVYPSIYEGFGIPPLEAMSFGCPVVCANTSSLPEVVGDAAELFNPTDGVQMRTTIERVVSSPESAKILVHRGYERIKIFSWEKCAQDTLNIYKKVLQG